jgi:hypothetical protein
MSHLMSWLVHVTPDVVAGACHVCAGLADSLTRPLTLLQVCIAYLSTPTSPPQPPSPGLPPSSSPETSSKNATCPETASETAVPEAPHHSHVLAPLLVQVPSVLAPSFSVSGGGGTPSSSAAGGRELKGGPA